MVAAMTVKSPTAIRLHRTDGQANKRMHQTKSVMAPRTTAFAGDPQRSLDERGNDGVDGREKLSRCGAWSAIEPHRGAIASRR
jgi:hypothetical protein